MLIFDPHTQTNLLPLHGYSNGPQIGYRPSPSIKKGASSLQICNHITTKHMMLKVLNWERERKRKREIFNFHLYCESLFWAFKSMRIHLDKVLSSST